MCLGIKACILTVECLMQEVSKILHRHVDLCVLFSSLFNLPLIKRYSCGKSKALPENGYVYSSHEEKSTLIPTRPKSFSRVRVNPLIDRPRQTSLSPLFSPSLSLSLSSVAKNLDSFLFSFTTLV